MLAVLMTVTLMPVQNAHAIDMYDGGYALSLSQQTVYNSATSYAQIGVIYKNEGITVLREGDGWAQIEYSTSNGAKQGYIYNPNYRLYVYEISQYRNNSSVASVLANATVYYGPNTSKYGKAGSVNKGEYVAALGTSSGWTYIEYNTTAGRKRGYVQESKLDIFYWNRLADNLQEESSLVSTNTYVSGKHIVYAGPSNKYVQVGYVQDERIIEYSSMYEDAYGNLYEYIEYYVTGTSTKKSGFLKV